MRFLILTVSIATLLPVERAVAWGQEGHSIVAEIAQRRLNTAATTMVSDLLGPHTSLASVASWADGFRSRRPETSNWHFVDIPADSIEYDPDRDCADTAKGDCIVKALARARSTLACATDVDAKRDALRFAVHFVGDIHQPLHAIKEQLGGNGLKVRGEIHGATCRSQCRLGTLDSANLHMVWDTTLIRRTVYDWGSYVDRLEQAWLESEGFQLQVAAETPTDWALQSHALALLVWNPALVPSDGTLDDTYYQTVLPILDQQLALGGLRLARLLNDVAVSGCSDGLPAAGTPGSESGSRRLGNLGTANLQANTQQRGNSKVERSRYQEDQARVGDAAIAYLKERAGAVDKPAIVLDIDETSLDNWAEIQANDYGYVPETACDLAIADAACRVKGRGKSLKIPPVRPTLKLFNTARELGVAVFFITGRKDSERAMTEKNLEQAGYQGWARVLMAPGNGPRPPSAADFKAPQRAAIVLQGYTIVLNVGDQPSDLAGGYAEKSFLMPNPFYRIF